MSTPTLWSATSPPSMSWTPTPRSGAWWRRWGWPGPTMGCPSPRGPVWRHSVWTEHVNKVLILWTGNNKQPWRRQICQTFSLVRVAFLSHSDTAQHSYNSDQLRFETDFGAWASWVRSTWPIFYPRDHHRLPYFRQNHSQFPLLFKKIMKICLRSELI